MANTSLRVVIPVCGEGCILAQAVKVTVSSVSGSASPPGSAGAWDGSEVPVPPSPCDELCPSLLPAHALNVARHIINDNKTAISFFAFFNILYLQYNMDLGFIIR